MEKAPYIITVSNLVRNPKPYFNDLISGVTDEILLQRHARIIAKLIPVQTQKPKKTGN